MLIVKNGMNRNPRLPTNKNMISHRAQLSPMELWKEVHSRRQALPLKEDTDFVELAGNKVKHKIV
jgi:hypothetical protein